MASAITEQGSAATNASVKVPILPIVVCCALAVMLAIGCCGGVLFYLVKTGRLGGLAGASTAEPKKTETVVATHPVALEPLLVNLADDDGHTFLRVTIVLAEAEPVGQKKKEEGKPVSGENASVRDAILTVLGRHRAGDLLQADGKEKLKTELKASLSEHAPEAGVQAIYFTDFLVQR